MTLSKYPSSAAQYCALGGDRAPSTRCRTRPATSHSPLSAGGCQPDLQEGGGRHGGTAFRVKQGLVEVAAQPHRPTACYWWEADGQSCKERGGRHEGADGQFRVVSASRAAESEAAGTWLVQAA